MKRFLSSSGLAAVGMMGLTGCGLMNRHKGNYNLPGPTAAADQPDKILYERASNEIAHGRFDVGRLTLQALLNTYPDSEFLSKAKLAIADSYYNEGGVSGLTQAEAEYKDFITFFPTAPEAPEAQFRAGMAHFRMMGKPDRDRTEARLAEAEFKEFLMKYPDSKVMPRVKGRLREVQEVLGESDYRIAEFYYLKEANRAARSRFQEIADNYPNYSRADSALWYLGQTLERMKTPKDAAGYYSELITDHPLSPLVPDAKERLTALHEPIPHATRATLARARADRAYRPRQSMMGKFTGILSSAPDVSATRHGPVHLGQKPAPTVLAGAPESPGGSGIAVEQVSDSALKSDKPAAAKPEAGDPATKPAPTAQKSATGTPNSSGKDKAAQAKGSADKSKSENIPDLPTPTKKKGRFHFLKKIIP
ncbi:MAG TPA: outer membrane protein assembly factor BamD [Terriglobia bacterium]|nr:outer membrane protein assembly factor BamD [Terriglobia bacterium]